MKHAFEERTRGRLVDKLRDERWRSVRQRDAPAGLAGGEGGAREATSSASPTYSSANSSPAAAARDGDAPAHTFGKVSTVGGGAGAGRYFDERSPSHGSPHSQDRTGMRTAAYEQQKEAARRLTEGVSVDAAHKSSPFGRDRAFRNMEDVGAMVVQKAMAQSCKIAAIQVRSPSAPTVRALSLLL